MKDRIWLIVAVLVAPLIGLGGYIAYDQQHKARVRDYYEALADYRAYLESERSRDEASETAFESQASQAERDAYATGGRLAQDEARIKNEADRKQRQILREMSYFQRRMNGPPIPEWERLQKAAERAAMPRTFER